MKIMWLIRFKFLFEFMKLCYTQGKFVGAIQIFLKTAKNLFEWIKLFSVTTLK